MTKACLVPELSRMVLPTQYAVIAALRKLYPGGRLEVRADGRIAVPAITASSELADLSQLQDAPALPRLGRCNWLDDAGPAPMHGPLAAAQAWLGNAVDGVNARLAASAQAHPRRDAPEDR
jgi:hypothetical protein